MVGYDGIDDGGSDGGSKFVKKLSKVKKPQRTEKSISLENPSFMTSDIRLAFTKMGFSRIHDRKLLTIVEIFKNWKFCQLQAQRSYLHRVHLRRFRNPMGLSSRQIC